MIYEAQSDVNIRKEPRVVEWQVMGKFITNRVGQLSAGTQREIYSIVTHANGETWGRVSQADGAGVAQWVCINTLNRVFMKPIEVQPPSTPAPQPVSGWASEIDAWARTQGYTGVKP